MSPDQPTISVVIPCQHDPSLGETVRAALASIRDEGGATPDLIVVGQGDWETLPDDPAVRVLAAEQPLWPAAARNRGLAAARGALIVFLDADCCPLPGWFRTIRASQAAGDRVCSGAIVSPGDDYWQDCYNLAGFREFLAKLPPTRRRFLPSFCLWGPREAFLGVGGFDEAWRTAEDLDLTARLGRAGWELWFEPGARVLHRPRVGSLVTLWKRGLVHGARSIRARRRYPEAFGVGRWSTSPVALLLLGPLISAYVLARTFRDHPSWRARILACWLPIYLYRLAWCASAAVSRLTGTTDDDMVRNAAGRG